MDEENDTNIVSESHIDYIVCDWFKRSAFFRHAFLEKIGFDPTQFHFNNIKLSVWLGNRETDLLACFDDLANPSKKFLFMMENKKNSHLSEGQAEDYLKRGEAYRRGGYDGNPVSDFSTILIAPKNYTHKDAEIFQKRVDYEEMREWIAQSNENHDGLDKADALKQLDCVIANPGYIKQVDEKRTEFHHRYWRLANDIAPDLQMDKPIEQGEKGDWIYIHHGIASATDLDCQTWFFHKLSPKNQKTGSVELQFMTIQTQETWNKLEKIIDTSTDNEIQKRIPPSKAKKSLGTICATINVPRVDQNGSFGAQKDEITTGILAAQKLYQWVLKNIDGYEKAN